MNKRNRNITIALILSLLFHIGLLFLIDFYNWLSVQIAASEKETPKEVTVIFPENKPDSDAPMTIVDNQNANEQIPEDARLLSDKNSQARNEENNLPTQKNTPFSKGNVSHQELSNPRQQKKPQVPFGYKRFSSQALTGKKVNHTSQKDGKPNPFNQTGEQQTAAQNSGDGLNQRFQQESFSAEEVGALSLSTYAWEWAPYIRKLKIKHANVWYTPPAYNRLGIIHGQTKVIFEIARDGTLVRADVISHKGHESLQVSSIASIKAIFPFLPLPDTFPEETLTITATLVYPDLRKR